MRLQIDPADFQLVPTVQRRNTHQRPFSPKVVTAQLSKAVDRRGCRLHATDSLGSAQTAGERSNGAEAGTSAPSTALFPTELPYRRVLLKLSGEALRGGATAGIDPKVLQSVAREVVTASKKGVQVAVVVDYVGMLATCMNAIMLQSAIERLGTEVRVQTAIEMREIAEPYIRRRAIRHLERGRVVIFGAGTGAPFMTTDTAAALRAAEIDAEALLKATKVDGVFDCDPATNADAKLHRQLSFRQVMLGDLRVMDETAFALCKENDIKVVVFNLTTPGNIIRAMVGDSTVGTTVSTAGDSRSGPDGDVPGGGSPPLDRQQLTASC